MKWTRRKAFTLIQKLEPELARLGWHCGLTGGVLYNSKSNHDLDLVVYPHCSKTADPRVWQALLRRLGWYRVMTAPQLHRHWSNKGSYDQKHVEVWWVDGDEDKRVDIIYPVTYQEGSTYP